MVGRSVGGNSQTETKHVGYSFHKITNVLFKRTLVKNNRKLVMHVDNNWKTSDIKFRLVNCAEANPKTNTNFTDSRLLLPWNGNKIVISWLTLATSKPSSEHVSIHYTCLFVHTAYASKNTRYSMQSESVQEHLFTLK